MKKKLIFLCLFLQLFIVKQANSITYPTYPIPSYDVKVDGIVNFREQSQEDNTESTEARRAVKVQVETTGNQPQACSCSVLIYRLDQSISYGPFTVGCGQTLDVDIDYNLWGVLVESDVEVFVDVYIE